MQIEEKTPAEWCNDALQLLEKSDPNDLMQDPLYVRLILIHAVTRSKILTFLKPHLQDNHPLLFGSAAAQQAMTNLENVEHYMRYGVGKITLTEKAARYRLLFECGKTVYDMIKQTPELYDDPTIREIVDTPVPITFKD